MEELSIEEKSKCYDEAIKKARNIVNSINVGLIGKNSFEAVFPELKKSEDEKIRKELLEHCKNQAEPYIKTGNKCPQIQSWIAWLERQGEQSDANKEYWRGYNESKQCILDKYAEIEKQDKQKPADKVEPKFKSGDWIVDKEGNVHQVRNVVRNVSNNKDAYDLTDGGYIPTSNVENYHHFTIKDAKDGDVLITKNKNIFIFKSISDCTIYHYCGLYFERFVNSSGTVNGKAATQLPIGYVPATKIQRDLLFQKMKEAGYEWDEEKKELKKIEQKPDSGGFWEGYNTAKEKFEQKPIWSEEDYNKIETIACHLDNTDNECMAEVLRNIRDKYYHIIPHPQWKPSDEQMEALDRAQAELCSTEYNKPICDLIDTFNKLKE